MISSSLDAKRPFRFVLLDLDDPTIFIGRFKNNLDQILEGAKDSSIDVYACSDNNSES